jgi:hypothetical protein
MLDYFFYLIGGITLCLLFLGLTRKSFAFAIIGTLFLILLGMGLQGEGLDVASGSTETIVGNTTSIAPVYVNYTMVNSVWIFILSNLAIYGGLALVGGLMVIAVKRNL